jgi:hypothetical protein
MLLPVALAGILFLAPSPRWAWLRAFIAIVAGWVAMVALVVLVYNPEGIAYGQAIGEQFPERRFDNNTVASALLGGWIYPALMVAVAAVVRFVGQRRTKAAVADA